MRQYRPKRRGSKKVRFNKNKLMIICAAIAAVIITIIIINVNSSPKEADPTSVFAQNVTIQGISVGGLTTSEARTALNSKVQEMLTKAVIQIKVPSINKAADTNTDDKDSDSKADPSAKPSKSPSKSSKTSSKSSASPSDSAATTYTVTSQNNVVQYTAAQAGISVDVDATLKQAMEYSLSKNAPRSSKDDAPVMDFTLLYKVDQSVLNAVLQKDAVTWTRPAKDASYTLDTDKDEDKLTTKASPVKVDAVPGSQVDVASLTKSINDMVTLQSFKLIQAPVTVLQPKVTSDKLQNVTVIGTYSTSFGTAPLNRSERMYNIWKISSILNGTVIQPGQTISVNDIVGPRTSEGGWQSAPGIENGQYSDQPGGGICQVSSTLYNAAIRAELKIVDRTHHTYPSSYVPLGLDATISTDAPDLKLQNPTDFPVLIAITADVPKEKVQVDLYGINPRDYTLKFESVVKQEIPPTPDIYVEDATVPPGPPAQKMAAHTGYVVEAYKIYLKNGKEYDRELFHTDTYKPFGTVWGYNPTTPPIQVTNPSAAPTQSATATPSPTS